MDTLGLVLRVLVQSAQHQDWQGGMDLCAQVAPAFPHLRVVWADRAYLHKETLTGLVAKLDPAEFLRVHRSHAVNLRLVRELHPLLHGEFRIVLANGTEITSGRSYRQPIQRAFGLARSDVEP